MTEHTPGDVVVAENLCKHVSSPEGTLSILSDVNLQIHKGETVAVVGASGSGKTTLLGLMAGLDQPSGGRVRLCGHDLSELDEDGRAAVRAGRVGFVFQAFHLMPAFTALENVMLPLELAAGSEAADKARVLLERVGLGSRINHYPRQLSGGEQQRVAIARAFVMNPEVLFADEPTGNLDVRTGESIIELLFGINQEHNTTLVMVTHDERLAGHCSRRLELAEGQLL